MECALIMSIDRMGQRYGMLPSELMVQADTFDLVIMDMAMTFERHQEQASQPGYVPEASVEDLLKLREGL
jgi:hypothetical protein